MTSTKFALAIVQPASEAVDKFSEGFRTYLAELGLPVDNVLVGPAERMKVLQNVPDLVALVEESRRGEAMYISKFIAACGAGLFDAALNFVWDEVVVRLRKRVAAFDLGYFYDTAVPAAERQDYSTADDLAYLADAALIKGALNCGMLTELAYKHLDYIRDMRNWASAAHPNQAQLTGLQLSTWLETCLRDVILKEPEGAVLEVKRLLTNLRHQTITPAHVPQIAASIDRLPEDLAAALLRALAGTYCDPRQGVRVRDNIKLLAKKVWGSAPTGVRYEIGLKHATYAANADVDRKALAHEFLELVDGLAYQPEDALALEIQVIVNQLESAQDNMNNFYNEPPLARRLRRLIPDNGRVPVQVNEEYVRVLVRCRVGRRSGVAVAAVPEYDAMVDLFDASQIHAFIKTLGRPEIASRIGEDPGCHARYNEIATKLAGKAVSPRLKKVLDAMIAAPQVQIGKLSSDSRFKRLVAAAG